MLCQYAKGSLAIHAGLHFGRVIWVAEDLFGDAVNLTARLAASAKPGEILASRSFLDQLPEPDIRSFRVLDSMTFKGKNAPTEVYSFLEDVRAEKTEIILGGGLKNQPAGAEVTVVLRYRIGSWQCREQDTLLIGRSPDCDLVIEQPWISRQHAMLMVRRGKVHLNDQSSSGTYVTMPDGEETLLRRETALLTGSGNISPARRSTDAEAEVIHYEITGISPHWRLG
jgi:adenylate cyclase